MKIIADENITFAREAFSHFGNVELFQGRQITNSILRDADALVIRSITNVNEELLSGTNVKFVGTATIGWDHIDTNYLSKNNIAFSSAAGCNSDAVTEYFFTALFHISSKYGIPLRDKKLGIIGVGNIGSRVAGIASEIGIKVLLNDPPLARKKGIDKFVPLRDLMDCDILTLHVPLNMAGEDRTYHLIDKKILPLLNEGAIIINTSRGPVIETSALLKIMDEKKFITVLDVWENEPAVSVPLLEKTEIGTPHIAGYSFEGKINGTVMIYNALCRFAGYDPGWKYVPGPVSEKVLTVNKSGSFEERINSVLRQVYSIETDDRNMRAVIGMNKPDIPDYFDKLRKEYPLRKEFFNYRADYMDAEHSILETLGALRFRL